MPRRRALGAGVRQVTRDEKLEQIASTAVGVRFGMGAFSERLEEMSAGIPARGQGQGAKGDHSDPTWQAVEKPGKTAVTRFDRRVEEAHRAIEKLYDAYTEIAQPKRGIERLSDPGCEWCAAAAKAKGSPVPDHWSPVYGYVQFPGSKRRWRVCTWCYRFAVSRVGRRPEVEELWAHAEGRRVYVKTDQPSKMKAADRIARAS